MSNQFDVSTKRGNPSSDLHHELKVAPRAKSVWSDLPYRFGTIVVGVPSLWMIWCNDTLRLISFQVIHVLCCYEYIYHITAVYENKAISLKQPPDAPSSSTTPWLRLHQFLFVLVSFAMVNIPPSLFPPALLFVLAFITVFIIAIMQHQDSTQSSSSRLVLEQAQSSLFLLRILLSWYQGLFFIMIPFRSWMNVTSSFPVTGSGMGSAFPSAGAVHVTGFLPTVSLLFTVWNCDTGALVVGRMFGQKYIVGQATGSSLTSVLRQWLYYVSPSKSLEGLCGGVVAGIVTYVYLLPGFWHLIKLNSVPTGTTTTPPFDYDVHQCENVNHWVTCWIGCVLSLSSVLGDIVESSLKRLYRCKDSGRVLPGHGGIYDRFDSSLIAVVVYHFCFFSPQNEQGYSTGTCSIVASRGY